MGPKLFILYINNMCNISNLVKAFLFADDTNSFHANSNISRLNETICCVLDKLCVWFAVNKLIVNVTKTNYILFGSRVRVTKFLGVFIDMNF